MQRLAFLAAVLFAALCLIAGCNKKPEAAIVGKWESFEGAKVEIHFTTDGAMKVLRQGKEYKIQGDPSFSKYQFIDKDKIEAGNEKQGMKYKFSVRFEREDLVITGVGNNHVMLAISADGKPEFFPPYEGKHQQFRRIQ